MIGSLRGQAFRKHGATILVDVQGVGYEVLATEHVLQQIVRPGVELSLCVYTDVRENSISLIGFQNDAEKEVFLLLKKVKGIGSRLALSIISALAPQALLVAIGRGEVGTLQRVPGIGKKTAERLIVELREKVGELVHEIHPLSSHLERAVISSGSGANDAIMALEKLGFSGDLAREAVAATIRRLEPHSSAHRDAGELTRLALANL